MAVPSNAAAYLVNTTGGTYIDQTQGGTILGNTSTNTDQITKALALKDNATEFKDGTKPKVLANGLSTNQKALSAGTFAYEEAGKYVIAASSDTLSGVSKTNILITGQGGDINSIHQFLHSFGAKTVTALRAGRFSWTSTKRTGAAIGARINWLNIASGGMDSASAPAALNEDMFDPVAGSTGRKTDSAANPTRAIPGELVMKVDFVTLTVASGGDFFDYKAITGM
tara:strand:+ start:476 stop:1153 length:678 start_codon:yes stop_codon:yes gene_type:complete